MKKIHLTLEELHNAPQLLLDIMDIAFDESCIMDKEGTILYCSESSPLIWGRPNSESIGMNIRELDDGSPYPELLENGKAILNRPHIINNILCITHMIPLFDHDENIIGAFGTINIRGPEKLKEYIRDASKLQPATEKLLSQEIQRDYGRMSRFTTQYTLMDFLGQTAETQHLLTMAKKAAQVDYPVLIQGETGCGKEIIANGIHAANPHSKGQPFVTINCAAIPGNLLESELFGYEKGAFSGAASQKIGKFELAGNGTVLLDEIGEMDPMLQSKLLRVLEAKEFERVGGNEIIPFHARIIAATNADFDTKIKDNSFRADLYYRLSAIKLIIPALRDRKQDIPVLANHFLHIGDVNKDFAEDALELMNQYTWPGNVRELRNIVTQIIISEDSRIIDAEVLQKYLKVDEAAISESDNPQASSFSDLEKNYMLKILKKCGYNITSAAKEIGISRNTLYNRMNKYGITPKRTI